ncbi:MAG: cob(I)yrinic acid a,c-diamide adenosyltransferase [Nitrospirota bacterium]
MDQGLVIVFTGSGKGKTSAALGTALRASGHGMYVSMVQFIKSPLPTGEAQAAGRLAPELEFISMGRGFVTGEKGAIPLSEHRKAAADALSLARQRARSGYWDVLILDEINNAVKLGLVDIEDVLNLVRSKQPKLHVVLTGRDAHPDLIALADLVSEISDVKHPFERGVPARKGIDF